MAELHLIMENLIDAVITLYWDTLKEKKDKEVLSDGIYKVDAKMLKTNGKRSINGKMMRSHIK